MECDAVFEGGGVRGIGLVGALTCLEKEGFTWRRVAGTSAGAIIAALLVSGYKAKDMQNILSHMNFLKFLDKHPSRRIPLIGTALGVLKENGIYSGDYFENWIYELLKNKGIIRFKDLCTDGDVKLRVVASDITRKKPLILPDDLSDYNIDPMEFEIAKALRMSMSIPFYFKPVKLEYKGGTSYIVDGGVSWNYPITIFDKNNISNTPVIGFKFKNPKSSYTSEGRTDPIAFLFDIAHTMAARNIEGDLDEEDIKRTIFIPSMNVQVTEFNISRQKSVEIFRAGYKAAKEFINNWDGGNL